MGWMKVTMTPEQVTSGEHIKLQDMFEEWFVTSGAPAGAAMYTKRDGEEFYYYFSPQSVSTIGPILKVWNATECERPSKEGISFLVGHAADRESLLD